VNMSNSDSESTIRASSSEESSAAEVDFFLVVQKSALSVVNWKVYEKKKKKIEFALRDAIDRRRRRPEGTLTEFL